MNTELNTELNTEVVAVEVAEASEAVASTLVDRFVSLLSAVKDVEAATKFRASFRSAALEEHGMLSLDVVEFPSVAEVLAASEVIDARGWELFEYNEKIPFKGKVSYTVLVKGRVWLYNFGSDWVHCVMAHKGRGAGKPADIHALASAIMSPEVIENSVRQSPIGDMMEVLSSLSRAEKAQIAPLVIQLVKDWKASQQAELQAE